MGGKNDWQNNDFGTRAAMNQPFWIASGIADGSGAVRLFVSAGSMRNPQKLAPLYGGPTSFSFTGQANKSYLIYVRDNGGTPQFLVSGSDPITIVAGRCAPPTYDSEPIGYLDIGASVTTANLTGPWNGSSSSSYPYEQRGQMVGSVISRARTIYRNAAGGVEQIVGGGGGSINSGVRNQASTASGIAFVHLDDSVFLSDTRTLLHGSVTWMPSGVMTSAVLALAPVFVVWRGEKSNSSGGTDEPLGQFQDSRHYMFDQNPDGVSRGSQSVHTTSFTIVTSGTTQQGYALGVYMDNTTARADGGQLRVLGAQFIVRPGSRTKAIIDN